MARGADAGVERSLGVRTQQAEENKSLQAKGRVGRRKSDGEAGKPELLLLACWGL